MLDIIILDQLNDVFCGVVAQRVVVANCGVSPQVGPLKPQLSAIASNVSNTTCYSDI